MRPCNTCRAPITNDRLYCEVCEPTPDSIPRLENLETHDEDPSSASMHSWLPQFFYNTVYVGVWVAIVIMAIGTPIGMLIGDGRIGIVLGIILGSVIGLAFALLELYQSD